MDNNATWSSDMRLPGIDLPLMQTTGLRIEGDASNWHEHAIPLTVRERVMLDLMATLKNKTDWESKVFDNSIVGKWRGEALSSNNAVLSDGQTLSTGADVDAHQANTGDEKLISSNPARQRVITENLFRYCIDELRDQAADSQAKGFTEVMKANAVAYISDRNVSHDTKMALRSGVAPLEAVPENKKDWHPGSDGKVLDIVHPSLFPLIYGTSRYLPEGIVVLEGCSEYIGMGKTVPVVDPSPVIYGYSFKHQWLPCEVYIGPKGQANIMSYINNLPLEGNRALYAAVEEVITKAVPMWRYAVGSTMYDYVQPRIIIEGDGYDGNAAAKVEEDRRELARRKRERQAQQDGADEEEETSDDEDDEDDEYIEECYKSKYIMVPEPGPYEPRTKASTDEDIANFKQAFSTNNLQVIVKLANIHLTPEKPTYDGGSWHIEGLKNEHICASALYYYDSSNVTDSYLGFRESVNESYLSANKFSDYAYPAGPEYGQDHYHALREIYGLDEPDTMSTALQVLGKVLTCEGRLLVFPNVLQHRVMPFKLKDASKPGHRKLLALFLVDPSIKIPSTAIIPPQQRHWWAEQINQDGVLKKLPQELKDRVFEDVRDFPIGMEQAKQVREELMEERKAQLQQHEEHWQAYDYSFCEH